MIGAVFFNFPHFTISGFYKTFSPLPLTSKTHDSVDNVVSSIADPRYLSNVIPFAINENKTASVSWVKKALESPLCSREMEGGREKIIAGQPNLVKAPFHAPTKACCSWSFHLVQPAYCWLRGHDWARANGLKSSARNQHYRPRYLFMKNWNRNKQRRSWTVSERPKRVGCITTKLIEECLELSDEILSPSRRSNYEAWSREILLGLGFERAVFSAAYFGVFWKALADANRTQKSSLQTTWSRFFSRIEHPNQIKLEIIELDSSGLRIFYWIGRKL